MQAIPYDVSYAILSHKIVKHKEIIINVDASHPIMLWYDA